MMQFLILFPIMVMLENNLVNGLTLAGGRHEREIESLFDLPSTPKNDNNDDDNEDSPSRQSSTSSTVSSGKGMFAGIRRFLMPNTYKPPENSASTSSESTFPNKNGLTPEQLATTQSILDKVKRDREQKKDEEHNSNQQSLRNVVAHQFGDDPPNPGGAGDGAAEEHFEQMSPETRENIAKVRDTTLKVVTAACGVGQLGLSFGRATHGMKFLGGACTGYKAEDEKNATNNSSTNATSTPAGTNVDSSSNGLLQKEEYALVSSLPDVADALLASKATTKEVKKNLQKAVTKNLGKIGEGLGGSVWRVSHDEEGNNVLDFSSA